jgi:hypothetical protein
MHIQFSVKIKLYAALTRVWEWWSGMDMDALEDIVEKLVNKAQQPGAAQTDSEKE